MTGSGWGGRLMSVLVRPAPPPLWQGIAVAAAVIAVETLAVILLKQLAPSNAFGVVYLLGTVLIAMIWGFGLATATALASAVAYGYFRDWPQDTLDLTQPQTWTVIGVFFIVALLANTLAGLARARAVAADLAARQQAALRRVATLVARGVAPAEVFDAVVTELVRCLEARHGALVRHQPDGTAVVLAASGEPAPPAGERVTAPVVVDGRDWGAVIVGATRPGDAASRVRDFADLIATAVANAQARADLTASRARIVTAADDARRRIERDLHDGAQQRLVSLGLQLRLAEDSVPPDHAALKQQLAAVVDGLTGVSDDLREISRGIHPAILSKGGLGPAVKTLARRSAVPVRLAVDVPRRLPEYAEVAGYYVVAEALTNVAKHAAATEAAVSVVLEGDDLVLTVTDDGVGGADTTRGSGLIGLVDRVAAVGGELRCTSRPGAGTALRARIPLRQDSC